MAGIFLVLGVGIVIAVIVSVGEYCVQLKHDRKKAKNRVSLTAVKSVKVIIGALLSEKQLEFYQHKMFFTYIYCMSYFQKVPEESASAKPLCDGNSTGHIPDSCSDMTSSHPADEGFPSPKSYRQSKQTSIF